MFKDLLNQYFSGELDRLYRGRKRKLFLRHRTKEWIQRFKVLEKRRCKLNAKHLLRNSIKGESLLSKRIMKDASWIGAKFTFPVLHDDA